jgi:hypothetical protein
LCSMGETGLSRVDKRWNWEVIGRDGRDSRCSEVEERRSGRRAACEVKDGDGENRLLQAARETRPDKSMPIKRR